MFQLDSACESLMQDPVFLLRLYAKTAEQLTTRTKDGSRIMAPAFESVDRRYKQREGIVDANTLLTISRPIFPITALSDRELRVLLHMLPLTADNDERAGGSPSVEESGAEPTRLLEALRRLVPAAAWQLWYIVYKARSQIFKSESMSGLEMHLRDILSGHPVEPVSALEAERFLVDGSGGGLSASEAEFVLQYCQTTADGGIDAPVLHGLLFSDRIPSTVEYPILAARFAEASAECSPNTDGRSTGSLALLQALRGALSLSGPVAAARRVDEVEREEDIDFPTAVLEARLTGRQFFDLCRRLGVQFAQEQSDQLYYYLTNEPGALSGRVIVQMYRQYFPAVSSSYFQVAVGAVARTIVRSGDQLCFFALYTRLAEWGAGAVPIDAFVAAVRAAGVPQQTVSDLSVEWLRLKASTRVDIILLLCMPVPPSREAVIRKLFERLDTQQRGTVKAADVLTQFQPEKIEGEQVRKNAARWKNALRAYLDEVEEAQLSYELFAFFWFMLSAAVEDDPTYTMVVWQGYSLAERRLPRR